MSTFETVFRRASDLRYRILDGEGVVIRQRAGEVLGLNVLGAKVLDSVDGARTAGEIVAALSREYAVEPATLEHDVLAFLDELAAGGLIEPATAGGVGR